MPIYNPISNSDLIEQGVTNKYFTDATAIDVLKGYNLKNGLRAYKAALADVGRNPVHISIQGTSITFGAYASDLVATNYVSRIRTALQAKYGNVGQGNYFLPAGVTVASRALTPWWAWTGTWVATNAGIGGKSHYAGNSVSTATLTFTGTDIGIVYTRAGNGSPSGVTVTIDDVSQTPPDFSAATTKGNIKWYTGLSAAEHTMVITCDPTAKYCYLEDVLVLNPTVSGEKGVYVYGFGTGGATTANFKDASANLVASTNVQLAIIELGVNDASTLTPETFLANMTTIISNIKTGHPKTSVLLLSMYDWFASAEILTKMATIRQHIYTLAAQYDCAVLDIYGQWGSYATAAALGLWGSGEYNGNEGGDSIHPSDKGHRLLSDMILDVIM